MVRQKLLLTRSVALLGALAAVSPVAAQFGTIFGGPPRPPADIPQAAARSSDDRYYSARPQQPPIWPREPQVVQPPPGGYPPPPPGYPQQGYPPQQAGRPPGVQQQDLPPPPGATAAAARTAAARPAPAARHARRDAGDARAAERRGRDRAAGAEDPEQSGDVLRARQDHRPHHLVRRGDQRDGAVRRAAGDAARLLHAPADRDAEHRRFLEVDEITLQGEIKRLFTGWMFAASPGLHAIEHPIYDVWLADCKGPQAPDGRRGHAGGAAAGAAPAAAARQAAGAAEGRATGPAAARALPPPPQSIIR